MAAIPHTRLPVRRRSRGPHPATGEALRRRVLSERGRIGRLSRIRELVLGFQGGMALLRSGIEVLLLGGASAGIGYLIGNLIAG